jgi:hypothetical protein
VTYILARIAAAGLLSLTSLIVILFRVSPLSTPGLAVPFFFLTVFLTIASFGTLLFYASWSRLSMEGMDAGRKLSISLREGLMLSGATFLLLLFLLLGILTWWIGLLIYLIFFLIEMALLS